MIKSAFQSHFAQLPQVQRPRSMFKRVSRHKHTFDEGLLIPFYLDEVLPGDTFNVKASMFARLATPIFPIMDNMYLETFWFYDPNRLVWNNFVKQHGEQTDPGDSVDYTTPVIDAATIAANSAVMSLWDNFGLPMVGKEFLDKISALPFRMYNHIFDEFFRDQDLQDSETFPKTDGPDDLANYQIKRINKFKDYFTTMRPAPQKGPAVELPLAGTIPITGAGDVWGTTSVLPSAATQNNAPIFAGWADTSATDQQVRGPFGYVTTSGVNAADPVDPTVAESAGSGTWSATGRSDLAGLNKTLSVAHRAAATAPWALDVSTVTANAAAATGPTINQVREAFTIQQVYELDMRGGTRFIEMLFNHFGVINPDFRLQRPEFLGYARSQVNIHPVPQTSETDATTPQGNLAAFGTVSSHGNGFRKSFTEHGYVIGLVAVRADLTYQEGVDRHWSRQTRFQYYYPAFANLGEQAVLNQELQVNPAAATNNEGVAGYQEHWGDYRYKTSKITGLFRSSAPASLDAWHLAQELTFPVLLDSDFVEEDAPVDRCIAVTSEPHFIFDAIVENMTERPMPVYSAPGLTRL